MVSQKRAKAMMKASRADDRAMAMVKAFLQKLGVRGTAELATNVRRLGTVPIAIMCSGSNITAVLMERLLKAVGEATLHDAFACECHKNKCSGLQHLDSMLRHGGKHTTHVFTNSMGMGLAEAPCEVHGTSCIARALVGLSRTGCNYCFRVCKRFYLKR